MQYPSLAECGRLLENEGEQRRCRKWHNNRDYGDSSLSGDVWPDAKIITR